MSAKRQQMSKMTDNTIGILGEVLFDQFPDGRQVLGGAPFNVAWHLQAFGQNPWFISRVGNDAMGKRIRQVMVDWGMVADNLQTDPDYPTGAVKVTINRDEPSYEIPDNQAYDFISAQQLNPDYQYGIIYHGTLALRNRISEQALNELTTRHNGKIFIDANLRAPWWRKESVNQWLSKASWVKLNHAELMHLQSAQGTLQDAMGLFLTRHNLDVLIVTCGKSGAVALDNTGEFIEVTPANNLSIVDTVGAGDAFAAVLLLGMLLASVLDDGAGAGICVRSGKPTGSDCAEFKFLSDV